MAPEKVSTLLPCILLLISVLFVAQLAHTGGGGGNDGSKMDVRGSKSNPASSRTDHHASYGALNPGGPAVSCPRGRPYRDCLPRSNGVQRNCNNVYSRNC